MWFSWGQGAASSQKKDEEFFRHVWEFVNVGTKRGDTLPAGNYEWPFDHVFPGHFPESVEGLWDDWIIYRMKATIDRGLLAPNVFARKRIRVVRTLDTAALESLRKWYTVWHQAAVKILPLTMARLWRTPGTKRSTTP